MGQKMENRERIKKREPIKQEQAKREQEKQEQAKREQEKHEQERILRKENDRSTRVIQYFFVGLFVLMAGYLVYFNVARAPEVLANSNNTRVDSQAEKVVRGSIIAANGSVLACTEVDESGAETRVYPYGKMFSHVVGMSTRGKSGIEGLANYYLLSADSNVLKKAYTEASGRKLAGDNVYTTLDVALQKAAYLALGENKGAVVAIDPATGKILAMVSKPDYDPNLAIDMWEDWVSDTSGGSVLYNRATQGMYPPGSTFKILTAIEYIREFPDFESFRYSCSGSTTTSTSTIHCYNSTVHGYETLTSAFANSCNAAFSTMGQQIDGDSFHALAEDFLFNKEIPIGIESNQSKFSMTSKSSVGEVMQTTIGQGNTLISPLHNALIAATVANGGIMMKPYLIEKIQTADNQAVTSYAPEEYATVLTEQEADTLTGYMRSVVTSGTGRSFKNADYEVAGKTGTAEYDEDGNSHSWFVGFAPAEHPSIAISVVLEGGYTGYDSAQEVAKKVLDVYFTP